MRSAARKRLSGRAPPSATSARAPASSPWTWRPEQCERKWSSNRLLEEVIYATAEFLARNGTRPERLDGTNSIPTIREEDFVCFLHIPEENGALHDRHGSQHPSTSHPRSRTTLERRSPQP